MLAIEVSVGCKIDDVDWRGVAYLPLPTTTVSFQRQVRHAIDDALRALDAYGHVDPSSIELLAMSCELPKGTHWVATEDGYHKSIDGNGTFTFANVTNFPEGDNK